MFTLKHICLKDNTYSLLISCRGLLVKSLHEIRVQVVGIHLEKTHVLMLRVIKLNNPFFDEVLKKSMKEIQLLFAKSWVFGEAHEFLQGDNVWIGFSLSMRTQKSSEKTIKKVRFPFWKSFCSSKEELD